MTIQEQLFFCKTCMNRKFDLTVGILCVLTSKKPDFKEACSSYNIDIAETKRLKAIEEAVKEEAQTEGSGGFFAPERAWVEKGVVGGIIMMLIAVVWFIAGYAAGYIFFYPPILFIIGLIAFLKGVLCGNFSGHH